MIGMASVLIGSAYGAWKFAQSAKELIDTRKSIKKCDIALMVLNDPSTTMDNLAERLEQAALDNPKIFREKTSRGHFLRNRKEKSVSF